MGDLNMKAKTIHLLEKTVSSGCQIYFNTIQNTNHKEIIDKLDYIKNKNFCLYLTCNSNKLIRK